MNKFPSNSGPRKISKWIQTIMPFWIEDTNHFFRYNLGNSMMISYNYINSKTFSISYWFDITSSTIYRNNKRDIFFFKIIKKITLQAIAIIDSMRKFFSCFYSNFIEESNENGCGAYAVYIIISGYSNNLASFFCEENPIHCFLHIRYKKWIMKHGKIGFKKFFLLFRIKRDPSITAKNIFQR